MSRTAHPLRVAVALLWSVRGGTTPVHGGQWRTTFLQVTQHFCANPHVTRSPGSELRHLGLQRLVATER